MPEAFFRPTDRESKLQLLRAAQARNRITFLFVSLKYYAVTRELRKLIMVIDNCDQKDPILIESFVDTLCHLDRCFEGLVGSYDIIPDFISIVSCRPPTRWMLETAAHENSLGSHGWKSITVDTPCSLAQLIRQRFEHSQHRDKLGTVHIRSNNGIVWETARHELLLHRLCDALEHAKQGSRLLALSNGNVADALKAMIEILSNRYFIDLDAIVGDVVEQQRSTVGTLCWPDIIRTLAYGNPASTPIYPVRHTRIPNMLSGAYSLFPKDFLKPRIIQLLVINAKGADGTCNVDDLFELANTFFAKTREAVTALLDELYEQQLIDTDCGHAPSASGSRYSIVATSRSRQLWDDLAASDVLLACYRDDLQLSSKHQYQRIPTHTLTLKQRCEELLWLCEDAIEAEVRELEALSQRASYCDFAEAFGGTLISERMLAGVGVGMYTFYRHHLRERDGLGLEEQLKALDSHLIAAKLSLDK